MSDSLNLSRVWFILRQLLEMLSSHEARCHRCWEYSAVQRYAVTVVGTAQYDECPYIKCMDVFSTHHLDV